MSLTAHEKHVIASVRALAELKDEAEFTARSGVADPDLARAYVLGELQFFARELAAIAEQDRAADPAVQVKFSA